MSNGSVVYVIHLFLSSLQIMVNEKDPRGLLEILTIIKKICILFDSQLDLNISGELFDIVSNYFPITFTRPPNDIYKITAVYTLLKNYSLQEDLKQSLNSCFLSSSHLQEFLLPFLLDRIDSGIYNNQKDGLHLLHEHIQKFNLDFVMTDMDDWIEILIVHTFQSLLYGRIKASMGWMTLSNKKRLVFLH